MKVINQVFETTNYDSFVFLENNRDIKINRKLEDSVSKKGVLIPVIVNEKFEVVDGQHRLVIAKRLNKPVPFIIVNGISSEEMIQINTTSEKWKVEDFIKSYAANGREEYQMLEDLIELEILPPSTLTRLAMDSTDANKPLELTKQGRFKFANYDFLIDFLDFYEELMQNLSRKPSTGFAESVYRLYRIKKFDGKRLIKKSGVIQRDTRGVRKQGVLTEILVGIYHKGLTVDSPKRLSWDTDNSGNVVFFDEIKEEIENARRQPDA